ARAARRRRRSRTSGRRDRAVAVPEQEGERLQKLLARAGLGSRRACEVLIAQGRVTVDETRVYWLLNKPAGYVTTASDPQGRSTVIELVPDEPRVFAVGRLDRDTEGL